ncbi:MAG: 3D domain-containing protein [Desulfofustis sp.]|nr:3D domain-containing protein [Desulfofustis sp.]
MSSGAQQGAPYSGRTASGTYPREPQEGFFSLDSLQRPWMIPVRMLLPWKFLPSDGTIAADTKYYPFGTRMYVPDYGWGRVEDRGSAIKGPTRIDIFYHSHQDALQWGRRRVNVTIVRQ